MSNASKQLRRDWRAACIKRDGRCLLCNTKHNDDTNYEVHHITPRNNAPGGGYVLENGITLCGDETKNRCHYVVEKYFERYPPHQLYALIGVTPDQAREAMEATVDDNS